MTCPAHLPTRRSAHLSLVGQQGSTLVETMMGATIAAFGLIGLYVANSQCLSTARAHREILTAEHCLEQRNEQCRAATWTQLTTPSGVQALMSVASVNDAALGSHSEKITIAANPAVTPPVNPIIVTRDPNGNTTLVSQPPSGFYLQNSASVRIDFQETWTSAQGGRTRSRETATVVASKGTLSR